MSKEMVSMETSVSIEITGDWTIRVVGEESVTLEVPPPQVHHVRDEEYASLPVYKDKSLGYDRGERLLALRTGGATTTGLLHSASVRIKPSKNGILFVAGRDYQIDYVWGTFGRLEGGAIAEGQKVYIDYDYTPCRLDSIVRDSQGQIRFIEGNYGVGLMPIPSIAKDDVLLARLWLNGPIVRLTNENFFPILPSSLSSNNVSVAEQLLPRTLKKLREGKPLKIVAWGDSVTEGGDVGQPGYQYIFVDRLKHRFPQAQIILQTAGWPGATSQNYIDAPAGGKYDFVRDCLDSRPDLVTIEFVNDASFFNEEETQTQYSKILRHFMNISAEVIFIAPHYIRPDWMNANTLKLDEDPRPYVKGLRKFTSDNKIALADTPKYWADLYRQGIPYMIYMINGINHPDIRGHRLFADALMDLFPET
jgi:lysophospholipase L1-like esterase